MKLQILGTGCAKCEKLYKLAELAANELQLDYEIEKEEDIINIMSFGVMLTPALVIDGQVELVGIIPSLDKMKKLLSEK
ncbi:MAG: thioredoxin family protein [Candidatus Marinimicrobia bacterium]|nr:thioredoxin family protein [Candidatus Neomarinimicrobiota bacterium]